MTGVPRTVAGAISLALVLFLTPVPSSAQSDNRTSQEIALELIRTTGAKNMAIQMGEQMTILIVQNWKARFQNMTDEHAKVAGKSVNAVYAENIDSAMPAMAELYTQEFSRSELLELSAFYQTPIGKKAIATMPVIAQKSIAIGQEWGKSLVPKIAERLKKDIKEAGLPPLK